MWWTRCATPRTTNCAGFRMRRFANVAPPLLPDMHIFTSVFKLQTKDGVILEPGIRYVVPSHIARGIESELVSHAGAEAGYRLSHFNSYERRYHGQTLGAEEVLCVYRHGAIGDTLMTTALVAELRRRSPLARI